MVEVEVMGMSAMRRDVQGRREPGRGMSRNWRVWGGEGEVFCGVGEELLVGVLVDWDGG